ncbi:MAG: glycoside hydrolase family 2 TIM barrel-domain containing protein [Phycisphaerae bacterium]
MDQLRKIHYYDLSKLEWKLTGWIPHIWRLEQRPDMTLSQIPEVPAITAKVPGSVQWSLREKGIIPDWNQGLNARKCEWVENRHWMYEAVIPDEWIQDGTALYMVCRGLDYSGWVLINGKEVGTFKGSHVPHTFALIPHLAKEKNFLQIVFDCPPRWLGQFGFTSQMTEWKVRFNYLWDWVGRLVQIGIWDSIFLKASRGWEIKEFRCTTTTNYRTRTGEAWMAGSVLGEADAVVRLSLEQDGRILKTQDVNGSELAAGVTWTDLPIELWWPNGQGNRPLYTLHCRLLDKEGTENDAVARPVGFRQIEWKRCEDAPKNADPWLCVVNGKPIFLQGINWVPILANFAEVTPDDYRKRLEVYRDLGVNVLRVWGGGILEREVFYSMCDQMGFLVWQEFPLSSSGADNWPPEDKKSIAELSEIARSFIVRRQHHPSLFLWCGGNELLGDQSGNKVGSNKPVDFSHPLLRRFKKIVSELDPGRRCLSGSPSGPRTSGVEEDFGKNVHWDVHGPWKVEGRVDDKWIRYWKNDDALFRSELGAPGASPVDIIEYFKGDLPAFPASAENPLWRRPLPWWIEWPVFVEEKEREPKDLAEYVAWSQQRQANALTIAVRACKDRFPKCGGVIIWMGHDCYPCSANTSIVDFHGRPKPAALALRKIFRHNLIKEGPA